jgi:soluble lytic murein transglycosylase-like protein
MYAEDDYDDLYEDEYGSQESDYVSIPLPFLVIAAVLGLILALSRVEINLPASAGDSVTLGESAPSGQVIAPLFTPEVQYWAENIAAWSEQTGIDSNLIATVMQIESCGDPRAHSSAGAIGLFQVMPYHFESGEDPYKPATNARRGLDYLKRALEAREGAARLGLAGYNGGISGAQRPESQWVSETQRYVYWGTGIYEDAVKGQANSARLDEWLGHGGSSLCDQAAQRLGLQR